MRYIGRVNSDGRPDEVYSLNEINVVLKDSALNHIIEFVIITM